MRIIDHNISNGHITEHNTNRFRLESENLEISVLEKDGAIHIHEVNGFGLVVVPQSGNAIILKKGDH